jgi:hypothetical protein
MYRMPSACNNVASRVVACYEGEWKREWRGMKRIEEGKYEESAMTEDIMEVEVTGILERRSTGKCIDMQRPSWLGHGITGKYMDVQKP